MQSVRFAAVVIVIFLFALGMAGLLSFFKYEKTFRQIVEARIAVIGDSLRTNVETALSLGLQFGEMERLQALIEREKKADPLILSIDVFTPTGEIINSTDKSRVKTQTPANWESDRINFGDEMWRSNDGENPTIGVNLLNDFDQKVGAVALRYSKNSISRAVIEMGKEISRFAGLTLVISAIIAILLALWVYQLIQGALRRQRERFAIPERDAPADPELNAFHADINQALQAISGFEETLVQIRQGDGK